MEMVSKHHSHYNRRIENMKRVITFIAELTIGMMVVTFVTACFFGAVLQESYKLSPLTAEEVQGYGN